MYPHHNNQKKKKKGKLATGEKALHAGDRCRASWGLDVLIFSVKVLTW
jgi:hypothetical protein